ncbi:MAG: YchJ family protein [Planctomycetota bacterium]|nr:YchJ family protein [Planctomycetota bacterium]
MSQCPCNSGNQKTACCGPIIEGARNAETAAELMRSRYTAFATQEINYLKSSHDPETRDQFDEEQTRQWSGKAEWSGFEILNQQDGGPDDDSGIVEFVAHYAIEGEAIGHHEISEFRRRDGVWFFHDGREVPITVRRETPKIGRNDPCPCGSGKKYKKCCART